MNKRYLVEPIKQPNISSCWYTAMLMLDNWRKQHVGWNWISQPDLETVVYQGGNAARTAVNYFSRANIGAFLLEHRFTSRNIAISPQSFAQLLEEGRPFGYVAEAGNAYQHIVVITGIEKKSKGMYSIFYIDPYLGQSRHTEFFNFMRGYLPAWGNDAFVVIP